MSTSLAIETKHVVDVGKASDVAETVKDVKKCILLIIDSSEANRDADIFIVPQEEICDSMRNLFVKASVVEDLCEEENFEWTRMMKIVDKYKIAYGNYPFGASQLIADRIRSRY